MAYPGYDAKTKLEIVKRIWRGAKVAHLSRRFGISRDSIHQWINEAEEGALKSISPSPPGPKVDLLVRSKKEIRTTKGLQCHLKLYQKIKYLGKT